MPAGARSAWRGSISFGGFPIPLAAYSLIESRSAKSFKSLCPCHQQPIVAPKRCAVDDTTVDSGSLLKGHEVSRGNVVVVPPEAAEQIRSVEATLQLEIKGLPRKSTMTRELALALAHYRIVPDEKQPGSEQPVQIIWNGLAASDRCLVTEWVPRAGSRDSLLVIEADAFGLTGHQLPYASEVKSGLPEFKPVENEQAAKMFEAFAQTAGIGMESFFHADFESQYEQRRDAAIQAALSGQPIATVAPAAPAAPDLMAMMTAALADAQAQAPAAKAPAKKRAAKKPKEPVA